MNRRKFLVRAGAATAAAALSDLPLGTAAAACVAPLPAVQLYTVRELLQRDPRAALAQLAAIGIVEGELYGLNGPESATLFGLPAHELKALLDSNGLRVPSTHIGGALPEASALAPIARALGIDTLIVALPNEFSGRRNGQFAMVPATGRAQLDELAAKLDRVGRGYKDHGLTFGYHNHYVEFIPVDGVVPYDYLMSRTDPELVKIELDLGWLAYAGQDPVAYLEKYAGRVVACHLKDYAPSIETDVPQRKLVEPGAGTMDFAAVLSAMQATNVSRGFIEIDVSADPFGAVRRGSEHLKALGECA
jgi:sugar phosphate isomerase/epimerase